MIDKRPSGRRSFGPRASTAHAHAPGSTARPAHAPHGRTHAASPAGTRPAHAAGTRAHPAGARPARKNARGRDVLRRGGPKPHQVHPPRTSGPSSNGNGDEKPVPPVEPGVVRIIPLGGVEEVGRNMTAVEFGDDIVIIDAGFQFQQDETPGVDYILPNTKYLEDRKEKIRGLFITHGHLDHIGAIPYIIDAIGYPPIYTRRFTSVMIRRRQEEFPHLKPVDIHEVESTDAIRAGSLKVRFFAVSHAIPDSMGIIIETPYGMVVFTGDLKVDHVNGIPTEKEEEQFAYFKDKKVLFLAVDSTNADEPGFSTATSVVYKNIEDTIANTKSRLIMGTFSSQVERIIYMIETAYKHGKSICIEGRSMKVNVEIARQLGMLKVPDKAFVGPQELESLPDSKVVILATGAQGEEFAALMRIATGTHKFVKIKKGDVVVLSSSIIPGNELSVQKLKDNISRKGARIIHRKMLDIHSSGHANRDELVWIQQRINPRFFMPVHGYHYMLRTHAEIAKACGRADDEIIIPDNSAVIEIRDEGTRITRRPEMAPAGLRLVDGFSIGDMQEVVIRDRTVLAQEGMFVIIATVNPKTGRLRKSPDIISRGFIYLRESQELLQQTRIIIKKTIEDTSKGQQPVNFDYVKNNVTDTVARFLFEKTNKRPIVIPVILGV